MEKYSYEKLEGEARTQRLIELMGDTRTEEIKPATGFLVEFATNGEKFFAIKKERNFFILAESKIPYSTNPDEYEYIGIENGRLKYKENNINSAQKVLRFMCESVYGGEFKFLEAKEFSKVNSLKEHFEHKKFLLLKEQEEKAAVAAATQPETAPEVAPQAEDDLDLDNLLEEDPIEQIKSMTGKVAYLIRENLNEVSSDTTKWILKSMISALDVSLVDMETRKEICRDILKAEPKSTQAEETPEMPEMPETPETSEVATKTNPVAESAKKVAKEMAIKESVTYKAKDLKNLKNGLVSSDKYFS